MRFLEGFCVPWCNRSVSRRPVTDTSRQINTATIAELSGTPRLGQKYYVIHCPMAKAENKDWGQPSMHIPNPYFDSTMLSCGSVKAEGK